MGVMATKRDVRASSVFGAILNGSMLTLVAITVLSQMPGISEETLPIYSIIVKYYGADSFLCMVYELALFLALLTTGTASTFNATTRYSELWYNSKLNKNKKLSKNVVSGIIAATLLVLTILIAQLGLRTIVGKGYMLVAYLKAPLALSAGFIFAPWRLWQMKKADNHSVAD
jgi:uncharacterized membrane protein YkvI